MGAIIGKLSFEHDELLARPPLEQMLDSVAYRASGSGREMYLAPGIAIGSTALGVATSTRVAADAVLTNARELRGDLRRAGCRITDPGDAALIAHAYEIWGERGFTRFDGPFACAIWDERTRRVILARDAIGIKPLYFAVLHGHGVVFASELKALFHDPGVTRDYCPEAIDAYLALGYVPAPLTAFRRVSKVEPGQYVVIDGRRLHAEQYWDTPAPAATSGVDEARRRLDARLRMVLRSERAADPAALLFSGGTASAALLLAAPHDGAPAITVGIDQATADLARTDAAARRLGRPPVMEVAAVDTPAIAAALAAGFDDPIADPQAVSQYATYVAARVHGASAISGIGAATLLDAASRHTVWDGEDRRGIYTRAFAWRVRSANPRSRYRELCEARPTDDPAARSMHVQLRSVLPESTLMIADRAALAAGLELRFPYLDRRFVEFAAALPSWVKRAGVGPMPLLRRLLIPHLDAGLLPAPAVAARTPQWLQRSLAAMVPSILLAPRFDGRGIVSRPALRALWEQHVRGRHDHALHFWSLLMLEFWFREHVDGDAAELPLEYAVLKAA